MLVVLIIIFFFLSMKRVIAWILVINPDHSMKLSEQNYGLESQF